MAPRKLSDADKQDVIEIYRQPGETTSTIAKRYGVSTSTISRILKTQLPEDEYRALISQKRSAPAEKPAVSPPQPVKDEKTTTPEKPVRRARKRSRIVEASPSQAEEDGQLELLAASEEVNDTADERSSSAQDDVSAVATELLEHSSDHDDDDLGEDLDDLDDLDEDLDDLDEDELDGEFDDDDSIDNDASLLGNSVEIMPIADAVFPRTCYLVVDRLSELITHPLNEFAELGTIPVDQASALTLPIFDNHRVARRFSRRNQRVIKVPDGQLITKATSYLQAKGITHLLIDGNIYSLLG
ncbi:transposase [Leptolyngbyaceae cyanobacterium CCMR0082]|uniref:Transposase n=2 Tax=Adonisia turfae TaxID=2950184 RepID=A0A6M0S466_9CYAN|nr:helix-turn-helix domain-containing protein [Adonisia turfae]MDV3350443.1 helix-turn-helix domain-containing protein [Leptothoe sp. LEGE 181152]NEZ59683.1 transposase [Adonisia turfae CCMR0081]NEZ63294.1 transposase [Adonisia turfae CCMR0082]